MMGNVVLGGKLPNPRLREFSWLMAWQRSSGGFVVKTENISCPAK
jgi:hypothetical protein